MISLSIPGNPVEWKRAGYRLWDGKIWIYDRQKAAKRKTISIIKKSFDTSPLSVPVAIDMEFHMPISKSTSKNDRAAMLSGELKHSKTPDIDNLVKYILDCLSGLVIEDDRLIYRISAIKKYSEEPKTIAHICVYDADEEIPCAL